ncbi:F-box/kelch-repeat protein [Canna indica]|uniref:F-box/kelch-repeat protein n=1 Tax=Canna indica TaxID=4628 RepID=A0AAQ3JR68_9LILI|nr:F-box/kelch-repeat protein [Canna indica]
MEISELIPGLPDEIGRECLLRLPFDAFRTAHAVCKIWKHDVESPTFHRLRKSAGLSRPVVALVLSDPPPIAAAANAKCYFPSPLLYRIALFEPATGAWSSPPMIPGCPHGLPLFCQLAAVGRELVVIGGWDPRTWAATDEVHVYDLVSGVWRRGARMPGPRRSFFACTAAAERRVVFVAGGHDESKNALRSALAYDVAADAWVPLPDMVRPRDECRGVFAGGAFRVVGGYPTEAQGQFSRSVEAFDLAAWRWGAVEERGRLEEAASPRACVVGGEGKLYMCGEAGEVTVLEEGGEGRWQRLAELPRDLRAALQMVAWEEGLMVLGSGVHGGTQVAYVLDLGHQERKGLKWRKVELPREYSGHVHAGCCFQI